MAKGVLAKRAVSTASALSQIGVATAPWGDEDDVDAVDHQFAAEGLGQAFEGKLGSAVGSDEGMGDLSADRTHHADAAGLGSFHAGGCAEEGGEGLGDDELADDVDLELVGKLRRLDVEEGAGHGDAGIVDQAGEGLAVEAGGCCFGAFFHGRLVGDVEKEGGEGLTELL